MASGPLVSVVTPFYNTDEYLAQCVESVLAQSYRNFEYLLVNNCSTDRSLEIAESYARKDPRIRVCTNDEFVSQVLNYNGALTLISPESAYLKMVQADDWLFPECLSEMVKVAEAHPSVGIVGGYRLDHVTVNCDGLPYPSTFMTGRDICRKTFLEGVAVFGSMTTLLFRSEAVRGRVPFFNETSRHEDTEACIEILKEHDFGFVHQVLTFTRRENESISTTIRRFDPKYLQGQLINVLRYGRDFLSEGEYQQCLRAIQWKYYRFLGERFWCRERKELFAYHREGLRNMGEDLLTRQVARQAIVALLDRVLDGGALLRRLSGIFDTKAT